MTKSTLLPSFALLVSLLAAAVVSDIRARRVSNKLNLAVLLCGLAVTMYGQGPAEGAKYALPGIGLALLIWFPMFALRLMGAGDVKLLAASGAWIGWYGIVLASLATGILGGILGVVWLLRAQGAFGAMHAVAVAARAPWLLKLRPYAAQDRLPYAVAIAGGVLTAWFIIYGRLLVRGGA